MTSRRQFITLLGGAAAAWPGAAWGQQAGKIARIGFLRQSGTVARHFDAFRTGMRALGYVEGQNLTIEQRYADGAYNRLDGLVAELIRLNLEVIVVDGTVAAKAVKVATAEIPVVFVLAADPVAEGLVASMARPGESLTGLTVTVGYQLAGKRVELLKDLMPGLARVAVLGNPDNPATRANLGESERVGSLLGLAVRGFDARTADDLPRSFAAMAQWRANGVATLPDGMYATQRGRIVALAQSHRLPAVYPNAQFVEVGGLLGYGPNVPDQWQRAALYGVKILKGAKPGELPIEQPTKFELVVNLKTAKFLGLTVGREFLLLADEVIE